ncbi:MAG: carboxypeptidase regulatory-like domain-containing protein [Planctomycetes bacterium]|nr:carboxypeptidase regulatory-like domain-containing protein [Planctomycetota bacterium]
MAILGVVAWVLFGPADREPDRNFALRDAQREAASVESAASAPMALDSGVRSSRAVEDDVGPPPGTPTATYDVEVRDDAGRAVEGATVRAEWHVVRPEILVLVQNSSPIARLLGEATTDASGFASIESPRGLMFDVSIEAPNHPTERLRQRLSGDRDRITLQPPASLVGTVKSIATGEPIEGASIELMRSSVSDVRRLASARTDAVGGFRVDGLPNAPLLAIVVAEGFELHAVGVTPLPGRANVLDVTLGNAVKLHGRVVDARSRDPVVGAELGMLNGMIALRTDADGRFRTTYVAADKLEFGYLWIEAPGYGYRTLFPALAPGEARDVELLVELEPARVVRGQAVDERGEPIVGLRILARSEQPDAEHPTRRFPDGFPKADLRIAVTDDRGRFEFDDLRPDTRHLLLPDDARYASQSTLVPARRADVADEDVGAVVFADARTIYGRVLDAADRPLPGIDVFAIPHPPLLQQIAPNESLEGLFAVDVQTTRTDPDGWFCFRTLGYGDVLLRLFDPAHGLIEQVVVVAEASQRSAMFEARIDVRPDISGWVRDATGAPVDIAAVTAHRPGTAAAQDVEVFTRSDGSFCLYRLESGTYELSAQLRDPYVDTRPMTAATASVELGMHGVTLVMHPAQLVELSVTNREGLPIVGARCRFVDPMDPRSEHERSIFSVAGCTIALPEHREFEVRIDLPEEAGGAGVRTHRAQFRTTSRSERGRFVFRAVD